MSSREVVVEGHSTEGHSGWPPPIPMQSGFGLHYSSSSHKQCHVLDMCAYIYMPCVCLWVMLHRPWSGYQHIVAVASVQMHLWSVVRMVE